MMRDICYTFVTNLGKDLFTFSVCESRLNLWGAFVVDALYVVSCFRRSLKIPSLL